MEDSFGSLDNPGAFTTEHVSLKYSVGAGIMVKDAHNIPMDIGRKSFFTQVRFSLGFRSSFAGSPCFFKRNEMTKYYPVRDNARNKTLFFSLLRRITRNRLLNWKGKYEVVRMLL